MPTFNYIVLTNDHTEVLSAGARTPRAMIADNDQALGRDRRRDLALVDLEVQSAIFVVEDDSQDGADHVDAHRIPAFAISPYAKRGAVVSTRYDFLSFIRSMELIMGMKPLGLGDRARDADVRRVPGHARRRALHGDPGEGRPARAQPVQRPGRRASARLPQGLDEIPQREMDALLWKSIHGWRSDAAAARPQRGRGRCGRGRVAPRHNPGRPCSGVPCATRTRSSALAIRAGRSGCSSSSPTWSCWAASACSRCTSTSTARRSGGS